MDNLVNHSVILAAFRDEPFGSLVAENLSLNGFKVTFAEELNDIQSSPRGSVLGGLHARSWSQRKEGLLLSTEIGTSLDIDHILASCDRVFLQPQAISDILGYLGALGDTTLKWLSKFPSEIPIIFLATPHFPSDLVLALLAQDAGHQVFVARTSLVDEHIWFGRLSGTQLSAIAEFHSGMTIRQQMDSAVPRRLELSREMNANLARRRWVGSRETARRFWWRFCRILLPDRANNFLGIQPLRRGPEHYWSHLGRFNMALVRLKFRIHVTLTRRVLDKSISGQIPNRYIYVPLHFQPERSTNPEGGTFRSQIGLVRALSDFLINNPDLNLSIVVKEHPRQNSGDIRQIRQRDRRYYETLRSIPRATIVPTDADSRSLIANASLVASVNGSSAWEALESGVAALTGVFTWHSGCAASPHWASVEDEPERLRTLVNMTPEQVHSCLTDFLDSPSFLIRGSISNKHLVDRESINQVADSMALAAAQLIRGDGVKWQKIP